MLLNVCSFKLSFIFVLTKQTNMNTQFFKSCSTLEQVKKLYRDLCKQHHPDKGGDTATMQQINIQYTEAINIIAKGGNLTEDEFNHEVSNAENYKQAINAIINLSGLFIEICGAWIWVEGNTKEHKDILKANGYYFASKKLKWYWRAPEYATKKSGHTLSMAEIRAKYGSQKVGNYQKAIA